MKYLFYLSICFLLFVSCVDNQAIIEEKISKELKSKENVDSIFLGLKFGMLNDQITEQLELKRNENDRRVIKKDKYRRFSSRSYSYEFVNNTILHGGKWDINPLYHNDSLIDLMIVADDWTKNDPSINKAYKEVVSLFTSKYGIPHHVYDNSTNWFIRNLHITICKYKHDYFYDRIIISYCNERRKRERVDGEFYYDVYANTLDEWFRPKDGGKGEKNRSFSKKNDDI